MLHTEYIWLNIFRLSSSPRCYLLNEHNCNEDLRDLKFVNLIRKYDPSQIQVHVHLMANVHAVVSTNSLQCNVRGIYVAYNEDEQSL